MIIILSWMISLSQPSGVRQSFPEISARKGWALIGIETLGI